MTNYASSWRRIVIDWLMPFRIIQILCWIGMAPLVRHSLINSWHIFLFGFSLYMIFSVFLILIYYVWYFLYDCMFRWHGTHFSMIHFHREFYWIALGLCVCVCILSWNEPRQPIIEDCISLSAFYSALTLSKNKFSSVGHFECDWKGFL